MKKLSIKEIFVVSKGEMNKAFLFPLGMMIIISFCPDLPVWQKEVTLTVREGAQQESPPLASTPG